MAKMNLQIFSKEMLVTIENALEEIITLKEKINNLTNEKNEVEEEKIENVQVAIENVLKEIITLRETIDNLKNEVEKEEVQPEEKTEEKEGAEDNLKEVETEREEVQPEEKRKENEEAEDNLKEVEAEKEEVKDNSKNVETEKIQLANNEIINNNFLDFDEKLTDYEKFETIMRLARDSNTPQDILDILLEQDAYEKYYDSEHLYGAIAQNPNTSQDALAKLACSDYDSVRESVAKNKNVSEDILKKLIFDKKYFVRRNAAKNENLSEKLINLMICKEIELTALAGNKCISGETIHAIYIKIGNVKKEDFYTRHLTIAANENTLEETLNDMLRINDKKINKIIARRKNVSKEILYKLSKNPSKDVRMKVAQNIYTSEDILYELVKDKDYFVRFEVAKNPNTSEEALMELFKAEEKKINKIIEKVEKKKELVINGSACSWQIVEEKKLYKYNSNICRAIIRHNNMRSQEILKKYAFDTDHYFRLNVAKNINTPLDILWELSYDTDYYVRKAAIKNLKSR